MGLHRGGDKALERGGGREEGHPCPCASSLPAGPSSLCSLRPVSASLSCAPSGQPTWSPWTPWSECSASCGPARRHRHRFCTRRPGMVLSSMALLPPLASATPLCPGPEAEEEPCLLPGCDRESLGALDGALCALWIPLALVKPPTTSSSAVPLGAGGWGPWGPWSSCSRSCGGGLRSRTRACDQPPPQGLGDYCEGPRAQGETCQVLPCPGTCQGWWGGVKEQRWGTWRKLHRATGRGGQPTHSAHPVPSPSDQLHGHSRG